ncbi:MAG: hypothetical protein R6W67_10380, partial [Bacteroidales bacterium]
MIAKLKKFTFLVYHKEYNDLLDRLREVGVVHIIEKGRSEEEHPAGELLAELRRFDNAARIVKRSLPEDDETAVKTDDIEAEPNDIVEKVESLTAETDDLKSRIQALKSEASKLQPWGDYEISDFEKLPETGWQISLFTCPSKRFREEWYDTWSIQIINIERGKTYFAVVHKPGETVEIDADPEKIGEKSAPKLISEVAQAEARIAEIKQILATSSVSWLKAIDSGRTDLLNRIEYTVAEKQAMEEAEGRLMILQGWVPLDSETLVAEAIGKKNV